MRVALVLFKVGWMLVVRSLFIPSKKFSAVNLFGVVVVRKEVEVTERLLNHERIHTRQMLEVMVLALLLSGVFIAVDKWILALLFILLSYYMWYCVEYLINLIRFRKPIVAYRMIAFEKEAYENHHNYNYLKKRNLFNFISYYGR